MRFLIESLQFSKILSQSIMTAQKYSLTLLLGTFSSFENQFFQFPPNFFSVHTFTLHPVSRKNWLLTSQSQNFLLFAQERSPPAIAEGLSERDFELYGADPVWIAHHHAAVSHAAGQVDARAKTGSSFPHYGCGVSGRCRPHLKKRTQPRPIIHRQLAPPALLVTSPRT